MSLDQLPNELISHIGSFMTSEDNIQFGLSQKRIHRILKRDGLDKPESKELVFEDTFYYYNLRDFESPNIPYKPKTDVKCLTIEGEIIKQFRNIDRVYFDNALVVGEDILKDLLKTKVNIGRLRIEFTDVVFEDTNLFVNVCTKFKSVVLYMPTMPTKFYCDEMFTAIVGNTRINLESFYDSDPLVDGYNLTDRTLMALSVNNIYDGFAMNRVFTSFTVNGIRQLVEKIVKADAKDVSLSLGILKLKEEENAVRWMEEIIANADSVYRIQRNDVILPPQNIIQYSIKLSRCINQHRSCIRFAINPVQV